jgi:hypothetical protein
MEKCRSIDCKHRMEKNQVVKIVTKKEEEE